jgi:hypothetical protein
MPPERPTHCGVATRNDFLSNTTMAGRYWKGSALKLRFAVVGFALWQLSAGLTALAGGTVCVVCDQQIPDMIYTISDAVKRAKVTMCQSCMELPNRCYLCGVPVRNHFTTLPDGRTLCKRDVRNVVLDATEAMQICTEVKSGLDRQFSRFLSFPETNVIVQMMDRVNLQERFLVIGNDYTCPNALGCTETVTNQNQREFVISLLTGMIKDDLITTTVHEHVHTWVIENISAARRKTLGKDAVEGFCELLSYLYAEAQGLATGKANILANHYTRGQIHLFIAAEKAYGLNDIVDWMQHGEDPLLLASDLSRVRRLAEPVKARTVSVSTVTIKRVGPAVAPRPQLPEKLILQGITWSPNRPTATVNSQILEPNQEAVVKLQAGPMTIRCVEITRTWVMLQTNQAPELLKLEFQ